MPQTHLSYKFNSSDKMATKITYVQLVAVLKLKTNLLEITIVLYLKSPRNLYINIWEWQGLVEAIRYDYLIT